MGANCSVGRRIILCERCTHTVIALGRPQEKPKPAPAPVPAPVPVALPPAPAVPEAAPVSVLESELQPQAQPESQGWEEPTTAQAPIWDDEPPQHHQTQPTTTLPITEDGWITSPPVISQPTLLKTEDPPAPPPSKVETETIVSAPEVAPSAFPAQLNLQQQHVSPIVSSAKPATPVGGLRGVPRTTNRFKTTDQAVVMPSAFSASVEKLGMQFGSVGLGSDDLDSAYVHLVFLYMFRIIYSFFAVLNLRRSHIMSLNLLLQLQNPRLYKSLLFRSLLPRNLLQLLYKLLRNHRRSHKPLSPRKAFSSRPFLSRFNKQRSRPSPHFSPLNKRLPLSSTPRLSHTHPYPLRLQPQQLHLPLSQASPHSKQPPLSHRFLPINNTFLSSSNKRHPQVRLKRLFKVKVSLNPNRSCINNTPTSHRILNSHSTPSQHNNPLNNSLHCTRVSQATHRTSANPVQNISTPPPLLQGRPRSHHTAHSIRSTNNLDTRLRPRIWLVLVATTSATATHHE